MADVIGDDCACDEICGLFWGLEIEGEFGGNTSESCDGGGFETALQSGVYFGL